MNINSGEGFPSAHQEVGYVAAAAMTAYVSQAGGLTLPVPGVGDFSVSSWKNLEGTDQPDGGGNTIEGGWLRTFDGQEIPCVLSARKRSMINKIIARITGDPARSQVRVELLMADIGNEKRADAI